MAVEFFSRQMAPPEGAKTSVRESEDGAGSGTTPWFGRMTDEVDFAKVPGCHFESG